jgi:hypothetical protein
MSDTPETDAAQHEGLLRTNPIPMQVVTANFARKLERERDEAREIIRMAKAKFCEEGSDGSIASEMFSILSGGK